MHTTTGNRKSQQFVAFLFALVLCLFSDVQADDVSREHGVMRPDAETLHRWKMNYLHAPQTQATSGSRLLYSGGAATSQNLLSRLDYTPSQRNQGQCGNCWIWAGTGVMEVALDVDHSIHDRLSIQYFNSNIETAIGKDCCDGGDLPYLVEFYSTPGYRQAVPWSNTNANWQDGDASCDTAGSSIGTEPNYPITSIQAVTIPTQGVGQSAAIENIKGVLNQNKAVYFTFFMPTATDGNNFYSFWDYNTEESIFDPDFSCGHAYSSGWGHAVLCVGYNDEDPDNSYWIMLNSWGTTPGRPNGLFRLDMNMNYDCQFDYYGYTYYSFDFWTLDITYSPPASANFTATPASGSPPLVVAFTDTSEGSYTSWSWDFGDGSTSTQQNPSHTYTTAGSFTVSLSVSGPSGTFTKTKANCITVVAPAISSSVPSLSNSCDRGGNAPPQSFVVWNSGAGTLDYSISPDKAWLSCTPSSGASTGTADRDTVTVDYDTTALAPGSHTANITITAPGASNTPLIIPVNLTVLTPAIACSEEWLANSCIVGCNAYSQTFSVWNSGTGTINYTVSSDQPWINCSTSGSSTGASDKKTITAYYTSSSLSAGTHSATITISDPMASNSPVSIPVTLNINPVPSPVIAHNAPSTLRVSCVQGGNPSSRSFNVWNAGGGTLGYSVSANQTWLSCSPSGGVSSASCSGGSTAVVTVNFSASGLAAGTHSARVIISGQGASNSPLSIPVSLTVSAPVAAVPAQPVISVTPSVITVSCVQGSNASSTSLDVGNSGSGTLDFTVYDNVSWLSCAPSGGSSSGPHAPVTVFFETASLGSGSYSGAVTISSSGASNTPQTIPVTLTVRESGTTDATFSLDPASIITTCIQGTDTADQSFDVWNSGNGTCGFSISADAQWISVSPASGVIGGDHAMITVHLDTSSLGTGVYEQYITIESDDPAVTNSPQTVPVTVTVTEPASLDSSGGGGGGGGGGCFMSSSAGRPDTLSGLLLGMLAAVLCTAVRCLRAAGMSGH